jgi:hypothetical protein
MTAADEREAALRASKLYGTMAFAEPDEPSAAGTRSDRGHSGG